MPKVNVKPERGLQTIIEKRRVTRERRKGEQFGTELWEVVYDESGEILDQRKIKDAEGRELPDDRPHTLHVGIKREKNMFDLMQDQFQALSRAAVDNEMESFEEADDYDLDDDSILPSSRYEVMEDEEPLSVIKERLAEAEKALKDRVNPDVKERVKRATKVKKAEGPPAPEGGEVEEPE